MKIEGLTMSEPNARYAIQTQDQYRYTEAPCEARVHVDTAYLIHHGPDRNHRPALKLVGELRGLSLHSDELPYGIEEITYPPGTGQRIEGVYEFTDNQLVDLVSKGYFQESFSVPPVMQGNTYELPLSADVIVLAPQGLDDVPVVFTEIHDPCSLQLTEETSEYDFAQYFEPVLEREADGTLVQRGAGRTGPIHGDGQIDNVLADLDLSDVVQYENLEERGAEVAAEQATADEFLQELEKTRAEVDAEVAAYQLQLREEDPTEAFYRDKVASQAADWTQDASEQEDEAEGSLAEEKVEVAEAEDEDTISFDDLDEEHDLGPAPIALTPEEEYSRGNEDSPRSRRDLRLRHEDASSEIDRDQDHGLG